MQEYSHSQFTQLEQFEILNKIFEKICRYCSCIVKSLNSFNYIFLCLLAVFQRKCEKDGVSSVKVKRVIQTRSILCSFTTIGKLQKGKGKKLEPELFAFWIKVRQKLSILRTIFSFFIWTVFPTFSPVFNTGEYSAFFALISSVCKPL